MVRLYRFPFSALGTCNEIQFYALDSDHALQAFARAREEVKRIEAKYSRYLETSLVGEINRSAGIIPVAVDDETAALLNFAASCFDLSGEMFDLTAGVLRRAWDFRNHRVPTVAELAQLLPLIGWSRVDWNGENIYLPLPGMEIDFGAFGKEYAVDRLTQVLEVNGIKHALVNLGGDLRVIGEAAPWRVGIKNPRRDGAIVGYLELASGAVATSGDYERSMIVDGQHYHHLLDPRSGWPVKTFQSVTVFATSCVLAGALATIAMLRGENEGSEFLNNSGLSYLTVNGEGKINRCTPNNLRGVACVDREIVHGIY